MASSSSSPAILQERYDVFLSFRGEDTRHNFTSHLYAALCQTNIAAFIDNELRAGDEIQGSLFKVIEQSRISVIIFSDNYASSRWCLEELAKILECRKRNGQIVIPVFYRIEPTVVRRQTERYRDAFIVHEQRFGPETVQRWRAALFEAASLTGFTSTNIRSEAKLVKEIVQVILRCLTVKSIPSYLEGLVGIDLHIKNIKSLLGNDNSSDFRVVGIWGMGGAGKTTIANVIFNEIRSQFDACIFMKNVGEESARKGPAQLKKHLLSEILRREVDIGIVDSIPKTIKDSLRSKKILIVLDDVNDPKQLKIFTRGFVGFGPGSRVIITTRDKKALGEYGEQNTYLVKELMYQDACELFSVYAFQRKSPPIEFLGSSKKVIDYAKGNPLALKLFGSFLSGKPMPEWERVLHDLRNLSNELIHRVLKISYDGLKLEERDLFLDIVCFFKGEDRNFAIEILNGYYSSADSILDTLFSKSLVTISSNNKLEVHDLLQEMGWEIVRQESVREPGNRSRLGNHEDICHILKNVTGTGAVECILLDMSKINEINLCPKAFKKMTKLSLLKFYVPCPPKFGDVDISQVHIPNGLEYPSNETRYFHWDGYPSETLPLEFNLENLITLKLPYSKIKQPWTGTKHAPRLKSINLCFSKHLTGFPNLLNATELESVYLEDCTSLSAIPSSIRDFTNLRILNMRGCESLKSFPNNIEFRSLITLDLSYCSSLTKFPHISGNIKYLYLSGTEIRELPSSIKNIKGLEELILEKCESLQTISSSICHLTSLEKIDVSGCLILKKLPQNIGNLMHLKEFKASRTALSQLPPSIPRWKEIICLALASSNFTEIPKDLCSLSSLAKLDLSGNNFRSLPSIKKLYQLKDLVLRECSMLQSIPELPHSLTYLDASDCKQLQSVAAPPSILEDFEEFIRKNIFECSHELPLGNVEFKFTNCRKLEQDLVDSEQGIQQMAMSALRLCHDEKGFDEIPIIRLCLPGREIPYWFNKRESGSSTTIVVPSHSYNTLFIGFALSAVIEFEDSYDKDGIEVNCNYNFHTDSEGFQWSCVVKLPNREIESDHIVMGYSPSTDVSLLKGDYTTVSFEFSALNCKHGGPAEGCRVKCCGVHPLYAETNMIQAGRRFNYSKRKFNEVSTSGGKIGKSNEEEVESPPKRTCRNQNNIPSTERFLSSIKRGLSTIFRWN